MVVDWTPFQRIVRLEAVRLGTVVVVELEDMVQSQRHHIVDACLAALLHDGGHHKDEVLIGAERLLQPLPGNLLGRQRWVPRQATEGVPVGLREMVAAPVAVLADVGHTSHASQPLRLYIAEKLLPQGSQVDQVARLSGVLLRNLQLGHIGGLANLVEDGAVWLARLEVERSVLGLQDDILAEIAVQRLELRDGLLHAVFALVVGSIDEATPDDGAAVRLQCVSQHIRTFGVGAVVVARTGLSLAVGLHQEATEVGDERVDVLGLALPPLAHASVLRVCRACLAERHGCGEIDGEVDADAVGAQQVGNLPHLVQILWGQHLWRCVHVVQHRAVDADGGIGARILAE